jgi:four helix bundle protein
MPLRDFKDLKVWQRSMDLLVDVYRVTALFPPEERFGRVAQTRRSAMSVPSNIAEGYARHHRAEYVHHLDFAYGSLAELETQLMAAQRLGFLREPDARVFAAIAEVERMLASLRRTLRSRPTPTVREEASAYLPSFVPAGPSAP